VCVCVRERERECRETGREREMRRERERERGWCTGCCICRYALPHISRSPSASVFVFVCLYIGSAAACVAPSSVGLCTSVSGLKH